MTVAPSGARRDRRAQSREKLGKRKRLGQVVIGASVEPCHTITDSIARGQHQHRCPLAVGTEAAAGLKPIDAWGIISKTRTS